MKSIAGGALKGAPLFLWSLIGGYLALSVCVDASESAYGQNLPVGRYSLFFETGGAARRVDDDAGNAVERIELGYLDIFAVGNATSYRINLDDLVFGDFFLSMRPFRCVEHLGKMFCYLPYPYENKRLIGTKDLTDLEYDLLFIARTPTEYGIDPWNGRYFRLRWTGEGFIGEIHETDLNILAAPPDNGSLRPLAEAELLPMRDGGKQWVPRLLIEKP